MKSSLLREIHNYIYANEGLSRTEALDEVTGILLTKLFDEKEQLNHFFIAKDEKKKIKDLGQARTFEKRIKELYKYAGQPRPKISSLTLAFGVEKLEKTRLRGQKDLAGKVFGEFIAKNQKADRGQFFTPSEIVKMAVALIKPGPNEIVLDPACGAGGFLIEAREFLGKGFEAQNVHGFEINPRAAQMARLGMELAGGEGSMIKITNSLRESQKGIADVILANPPFGSKGRISDPKIIQRYALGRGRKSQVPEILFIEQCINFLKKNGRLAIVVPNGILEGKNNQLVRNHIRRKTTVEQVIDLAEDAFSPYGTNVKTSLLILRKNKQWNGEIKFGKYRNGKVGERYEIGADQILGRLDYQFNKPQKVIKRRSVYLSEVVELAPMERPSNSSKQTKYVEISGINAANLMIEQVRTMRKASLPKRARQRLKKGDIVVSLVGNYLGTERQAVALIGKSEEGAWCSNGMAVVRKTMIDRNYLLYFLKSKAFGRQINRYKTRTTIPRVAVDDFMKIKMEIPREKELTKIIQGVRAYTEAVERARRIYKKAFGEGEFDKI